MDRVERSSDQVIKPLYQEALTKWVGQIPDDVVNDMANIAPMLATLGYDPNGNPPTYGVPEDGVSGQQQQQQTQQEQQQQQQSQYDANVSEDSKYTTRRRRR